MIAQGVENNIVYCNAVAAKNSLHGNLKIFTWKYKYLTWKNNLQVSGMQYLFAFLRKSTYLPGWLFYWTDPYFHDFIFDSVSMCHRTATNITKTQHIAITHPLQKYSKKCSINCILLRLFCIFWSKTHLTSYFISFS